MKAECSALNRTSVVLLPPVPPKKLRDRHSREDGKNVRDGDGQDAVKSCLLGMTWPYILQLWLLPQALPRVRTTPDNIPLELGGLQKEKQK